MNMIATLDRTDNHGLQSERPAEQQALVVIACDSPETAKQLEAVCEFFDLGAEVVPAEADLLKVLWQHHPMALIADIDGQHQDGFHTLKTVAAYDRDLPVLLLTAGDPIMMGAADAVQEVWNLTTVSPSTDAALAGQLAEFLFAAGRRAGCMRLVPI